MKETPPIVMTAEELFQITGYRQATKQLEELRRQGFVRARPHPFRRGNILERLHYEAVCRGCFGRLPSAPKQREPQLQP